MEESIMIEESGQDTAAEAVGVVPANEAKAGGDERAFLERIAALEQASKEISGLTLEVNELRKQILQRDRISLMIAELRELPKILPGADIMSIDEEGWQAILGGGSVLGAYVYSEHRRRSAEEANKAGELASAGAAGGGVGAVYSVDEIRGMDRRTVRQNLDKILSSLEAAK